MSPKVLDNEWDDIVVGTGLGGATAGYALSKAGRKVLFVEAGGTKSDLSEGNRVGLWSQPIKDQKKTFLPFLGEIVGGSSRYYGMVLERPEQSDFEGGLGLWPGSLSHWEPYLCSAETLLNANSVEWAGEFSSVVKHLQDQKLNPYPLRLAARNLSDCHFCQSQICSRDCKVDASTGPLRAALQNEDCQLLTNCRAVSISHTGDRATGIKIVSKEFGENHLRAKAVYIAAGALRTPFLLKNSPSGHFPNGLGSFSPSLGRNLMRHLVDLYILDWPELRSLNSEQRKRIAAMKCFGISDYYTYKGLKLGVIQSFGSLPNPDIVVAELLESLPLLNNIIGIRSFIKRYIEKLSTKPMLATIIEDSPSIQNGIDLRDSRKINMIYRVSSTDQKKIEQMRSLTRAAFKPFVKKVLKTTHDNHRLAHVAGTCRMGKKIDDSVVDFSCRVHEMNNLYVVDSSVFPSSLGKNPSLMIVANALRTVEKALTNG